MKISKRVSALACVAVCLLQFTSCQTSTGPSYLSLHISGAVTTFAGAPIAGAKVFLETIDIPYLLLASAKLDSALTDAQGRFAVSYVNSDMKCIRIYRLHVIADNSHEAYTNDLSGNGIKCTSALQTINLQM